MLIMRGALGVGFLKGSHTTNVFDLSILTLYGLQP